MCYLIARKPNFQGCIAIKRHHDKELDNLVKYLKKETEETIELITISRPESYAEYGPYTFVQDQGVFVATVKHMGEQVNRNIINSELVRRQMAAMCLKEHQELEPNLTNARVYHSWFQNSDNYLYVTYIVVRKERQSKISFRYLISTQDGTFQNIECIRTYSYDIINPDEIEY